MLRMRCGYCNKEIDSRDPNYGLTDIHYHCAANLQDEMDELGMIEIVSRSGDKVAWKVGESFEKVLSKTMDFLHSHLFHDETVDEDIIDMQGVVKAVSAYVPSSTSPKKMMYYMGFIFNGLMRQKYGVALPKDKMFHSRVKEFAEEVWSIPVDKKEVELYRKVFGKEFFRQKKTSERHGKLIKTFEINKELDEELDQATSHVLEVIEKLAKKIEKDFGASKKWRSFRMDELLLQTIRNMILVHYETTPSRSEVNLEQEDTEILNNALKLVLMDISEISSALAKRHNVPFDVVLARAIHNVIVNLVMYYVRMKTDYAKKHGLA